MTDREKKRRDSIAFIAMGAGFMASGMGMSAVNSGGFALAVVGVVFLVIGIINLKAAKVKGAEDRDQRRNR